MQTIQQHINIGSETIEKSRVENYENLFDKKDAETRKQSYEEVVNSYYDLASDFYLMGWGQSFHFAHRVEGETHLASLARHEHFLALKLEAKPGMKILDLGCGVGGPARSIARFSGCNVVGINNNAYQVKKGTELNKTYGLEKQVDLVKGDFMKLPFPDNSFDGAYQIEATCHAPDLEALYKEIRRVLKPGAKFVSYEWVLTKKYDPANETHKKIRYEIEIGDGLPDLRFADDVKHALSTSGFKVHELYDLAESATIPWYAPLDGSWSIEGFMYTRFGRWASAQMVKVLELVRVAPAGSSRVQAFLEKAAHGLVLGGKANIFTPMLFHCASKPTAEEEAAAASQ